MAARLYAVNTTIRSYHWTHGNAILWVVSVIYFCFIAYVLFCGEIYNYSYKRLYYHHLLCLTPKSRKGGQKKKTNVKRGKEKERPLSKSTELPSVGDVCQKSYRRLLFRRYDKPLVARFHLVFVLSTREHNLFYWKFCSNAIPQKMPLHITFQ